MLACDSENSDLMAFPMPAWILVELSLHLDYSQKNRGACIVDSRGGRFKYDTDHVLDNDDNA